MIVETHKELSNIWYARSHTSTYFIAFHCEKACLLDHRNATAELRTVHSDAEHIIY